MSVLDKPYFRSEKAAFKHLEKLLWPQGPVCPHCGSCVQPYDLAKTRIGLRKCREKECRKQFTVRVGTVFESSHIPLHKWMQAAFLMVSSKKGISSHQLHRTLEVTYKTAWFMAHRLREAMKAGGLPPIGGEGETVQVDETYFGTIDALRGKTWAEEDFTHTAYGSMEGKILNVGSHYNTPCFTLRPRLGGNDVRCLVKGDLVDSIGAAHSLEEIWKNQRVMIEGVIAYNAAGDPVNIDVEDIRRVVPKDVDLNNVTDPNFTGGLSAGEYLEKIREGDLD